MKKVYFGENNSDLIDPSNQWTNLPHWYCVPPTQLCFRLSRGKKFKIWDPMKKVYFGKNNLYLIHPSNQWTNLPHWQCVPLPLSSLFRISLLLSVLSPSLILTVFLSFSFLFFFTSYPFFFKQFSILLHILKSIK